MGRVLEFEYILFPFRLVPTDIFLTLLEIELFFDS